jgi:hypothetical protein
MKNVITDIDEVTVEWLTACDDLSCDELWRK